MYNLLITKISLSNPLFLKISLRSFPTPPFLSYSHGTKQDKLQKFMIAFAFFMLLMIPTVVWNVVGEKQSGMTVIYLFELYIFNI